jgi:ribonuclease HI
VSYSKILASIDSLKGYFSSDSQAMEALAVLQKKALSLNQQKSSESYPLPKEEGGTAKADYLLFSDGACRGNPGPGAWGILAQDAQGEVIFEKSGVDSLTTNNRMELRGAIEALNGLNLHLGDGSVSSQCRVHLFSDSRYLVDGINNWLPGWKRRGWKKADKKTPENLDYWKNLDQMRLAFAEVKFFWVRGHAGHPQNERCDQIANMALDQMKE